jgi:hypothetical protein
MYTKELLDIQNITNHSEFKEKRSIYVNYDDLINKERKLNEEYIGFTVKDSVVTMIKDLN